MGREWTENTPVQLRQKVLCFRGCKVYFCLEVGGKTCVEDK